MRASTEPTEGNLDSTKAANGSIKVHRPKISRKIKACQECQSRKIKCGLEPGASTCTRCRRLGLTCVVNKSLQTLLEDECEWRFSIESKTKRLERAVSQILQHLDLSNLDQASFSHSQSISPAIGPNEGVPELERLWGSQGGSSPSTSVDPTFPTIEQPSPNSTLVEESGVDPLMVTPLSSFLEAPKTRSLNNSPQIQGQQSFQRKMSHDFVSQGKVNLQEAESLFQHFRTALSQYLWGGLALVHENFQTARESSSILVAAILVVTALHIPGKENIYDIAYNELLSLVSTSMFSKGHCLDDVRGLCIAAFWLSEVSWKLSGHAVRIGTELNLHRSFHKAIRGQSEYVEHARLWYLLYVCDHQFSIAYGRPPVIQEDLTISCHDNFLQMYGMTQADWCLQSQVAVFKILSRIYHHFGQDPEKPLTEDDLEALRGYNAELDAWRNIWESRLGPNKYNASYPAQSVIIHWRFAKLQLNFLALRGVNPQAPNLPVFSSQRREFANIAVDCAIHILSSVLNEGSIRDSIIGAPIYLHTTITYAATFLFKVEMCWKYAMLAVPDLCVTLNLLQSLAELLLRAEASQKHLAFRMARGLNLMLNNNRPEQQAESPTDLPGMAAHKMVPITIPPASDHGVVSASVDGWKGVDSRMMSGPAELYGSQQDYFQVESIFDVVNSQVSG